MEQMPIELVEAILVLVDDRTLDISIPRVSKLFARILLDETSAVWRIKCQQKYLEADPSSRPPIQQYKNYYYKGKYS